MKTLNLPAVLFGLTLAFSTIHILSESPAPEEYRSAADEGTYLRQALAVRHGGLRAFAELGREFIDDPKLQQRPPPVRVGHLAAASIAVGLDESLRALSVLSVACFVALSVTTLFCARTLWGDPTAATAGILMAVSPLGAGLARRALIDTDHALFTGMALLAFAVWMRTARERDFAWLVLSLAWAALVKEVVLFFVPLLRAGARSSEAAARKRRVAPRGAHRRRARGGRRDLHRAFWRRRPDAGDLRSGAADDIWHAGELYRDLRRRTLVRVSG